MLFIAAEITDNARTMPTVERVLVRSIHASQDAASKAATRLSASGRDMRAIPVSMARPGSKQPKPGDTLATTTEASGLVAVAAVE